MAVACFELISRFHQECTDLNKLYSLLEPLSLSASLLTLVSSQTVVQYNVLMH